MTAKEIIKAIGYSALTDALSVTKYSVRHCAQDGVFPASWFVVVQRLCVEKNIECSEGLFSFKGQPKNKDAA